MAYVALYRAYRPQKFSEVVGQQHIIKTLQNAIKLNKVAHAYLFCGPRGTGKTTLAKIMAKALNCEHGPAIEPCNECAICKGIQKGNISDVIEIDAASNNGADDIRSLRDTVKFLPSVGKYKVYIIDEVHMLSNAAFNALLKTLEEPPKHVVFILATTEPYKLPNTILSRCQRFDFQAISLDDITKRLKLVCSDENINITDEAIHQIASSAEGGMRDALSLLDQCISYSVSPTIDLDDVLAVSGNVSYLKLIDLIESCLNNNETNSIVLMDDMLKQGKEVPRIINDIILFLRDVLLYKNQAVIDEKLMFKNDNFKKLANKVTKGIIYSWLDILNEALSSMRFSTQKRAYLELALLKMSDNRLNVEASLEDRLESLEYTINMLVNKKKENINVVEEKMVVPPLPTVDDIDNYSNIEKEKVETKTNLEVNITPIFKDKITVRDIEQILNNASKAKKEKLNKVWSQIAERYTNIFAIQILVNGHIVAASDDAFIVELQDVGFCNRVMLYENYVKIMEIFNEFDLNIKDYICIPKAVWSKIRIDYKKKYEAGNQQPILDDIEIGVNRRVIPTNQSQVKLENSIESDALEFFDEGQLKILEE
ncbi:TPA: DNA polymerase III subunit gamma/tau [Candidatus Avacholeplasma faecigallinarum]|nr:DNA polymerase III subunit gamma/tau [Candidatus Avacholeplasma faecigallinarum]